MNRVARTALLGVLLAAISLAFGAGCTDESTCECDVSEPAPTPARPEGPSYVAVGCMAPYSTTAISDATLEIRFDWGDGTYSEWGPEMTASHGWDREGIYDVRAQARFTSDPRSTSKWSFPLHMKTYEVPSGDGMAFLFCDLKADPPETWMEYRFFKVDEDTCLYLGWATGYTEWYLEALHMRQYFQYGWQCQAGWWPEETDLGVTPREDQDAEDAAVWLSGHLVAPQGLYETIHAYLGKIRATHGDSIPELYDIHFMRWDMGRLILTLTDEAWDQYLSGGCDDLDFLNAVFGGVVTQVLSSRRLVVEFAGRYHPVRLSEVYEGIPSVTRADYIDHAIANTFIPWPTDMPD